MLTVNRAAKYWVVCAVMLVATLGVSGDWPAFRGGDVQAVGQGTGYAVEWNSRDNVIWRTPIAGEGWSSPVVVNDRIYLTAAVESGGIKYHAICLDAGNGEVIWNRELFTQDRALGAAQHQKNSAASPTPVVEGDYLFVHFGSQGTACLTTDGEPVWVNRTLGYEPVHGNGGSPIIVGNKLIFTADGQSNPEVIALDKSTGRVAWRTPRGADVQNKFSFSTPLAIEVSGQQQVVAPGSGAVYGYDPNSGVALWAVGYGGGFSVVPQPVYANGLLFVSTGFVRPNLLAINPDGARGDVTQSSVVWSTGRGAPLTPTPVAVGDELYVVSDQGIASCMDAATGHVHWQQRIGGNYSASPISVEGRVYFFSEEGDVTVVAADTSFREIAKNRMDERLFATPAPVGGMLFIRSEGAVYRVEPSRIR